MFIQDSKLNSRESGQYNKGKKLLQSCKRITNEHLKLVFFERTIMLWKPLKVTAWTKKLPNWTKGQMTPWTTLWSAALLAFWTNLHANYFETTNYKWTVIMNVLIKLRTLFWPCRVDNKSRSLWPASKQHVAVSPDKLVHKAISSFVTMQRIVWDNSFQDTYAQMLTNPHQKAYRLFSLNCDEHRMNKFIDEGICWVLSCVWSVLEQNNTETRFSYSNWHLN